MPSEKGLQLIAARHPEGRPNAAKHPCLEEHAIGRIFPAGRIGLTKAGVTI